MMVKFNWEGTQREPPIETWNVHHPIETWNVHDQIETWNVHDQTEIRKEQRESVIIYLPWYVLESFSIPEMRKVHPREWMYEITLICTWFNADNLRKFTSIIASLNEHFAPLKALNQMLPFLPLIVGWLRKFDFCQILGWTCVWNVSLPCQNTNAFVTCSSPSRRKHH